MSGDDSQKIAGHGEDLQVVGAIEHVIRQPCITQLIVVEIHRPGGRRQSKIPNKAAEGGSGVEKQPFLPQFWLIAERVRVDPCEVISSKISTNQRRGQELWC